jgi:uncharacterized protein
VPSADSAEIAVRVQPRARRAEIAGIRGGAVLIRVQAPPVNGKANEAVCRLVAERAGLSRRSVSLLRGPRGRDKVLRVDGLSEAELLAKLGL